MNEDKIREIIRNKHTLYDLKIDQRKNKIGKGMKLINLQKDELPDYVISKRKEFATWFD